jgi:hypothetical protein
MVSCRVAGGCFACVGQHVCANSIHLPQCLASHTHLRSTNISKRYPPTTFSYFRQPFCTRPRFTRRAVRMGFMVYRIALGQVFFLVIRCSPVSIVLVQLSVHSSITQVDILGRTSIETVATHKRKQWNTFNEVCIIQTTNHLIFCENCRSTNPVGFARNSIVLWPL